MTEETRKKYLKIKLESWRKLSVEIRKEVIEKAKKLPQIRIINDDPDSPDVEFLSLRKKKND